MALLENILHSVNLQSHCMEWVLLLHLCIHRGRWSQPVRTTRCISGTCDNDVRLSYTLSNSTESGEYSLYSTQLFIYIYVFFRNEQAYAASTHISSQKWTSQGFHRKNMIIVHLIFHRKCESIWIFQLEEKLLTSQGCKALVRMNMWWSEHG